MNVTGITSVLVVVGGVAWSSAPVAAQHNDILVQRVGRQLATGTGQPASGGGGTMGTRVYAGFFNSSFAVSDPGFNSIGASGGTLPPGASALPGNSELSWDFLPMKVGGVTSTLLYWNGVGGVSFGAAPAPTYSFTLFGENFLPGTADGSSNLIPGQVVATTGANGAIHEHRFFFLDNDLNPDNAVVASQGVYLVAMRYRMTGLDRSDPVYMAWATPGASAAVTPAIAWVTSRVDQLAPSFDADFDGDLDVDGSDFLTWQRNLAMTSALQTHGDGDRNAVIGAGDLAVWRGEYGSSVATLPGAHAASAAGATNVPEPTAGAIAVAIALSWAVARPRQSRQRLIA